MAGEEREREQRKLVVKKVRRLRGNERTDPSSCPKDNGIQVYSDPSSCNQFYKCTDGVASHEVCENGLLFDENLALSDAAHNYCVYNWKANCGKKPIDDTPISSPGCLYQFGIFPIEQGCFYDYNKCEFGNATKMPCENDNENIPVHLGLAYDPDMHACNWPDLLLNQGCDPEALLGGFQCPTLNELIGTFNEQFSPFPRFAVDGDPRVYVICVSGLPRLQSCGAMDSFDEDSLTCVRRRPNFG